MKHVLVTRPQPQAERLNQRLQQAGFDSYVWPMLAIEPVPYEAVTGHFDRVIVTSQHAAQLGEDMIRQLTAPCFAIGAATMQTLQALGIKAQCAQHGENSESLLTLPAFRTLKAGARVLLVKGEGGRGLIPQVLQAAGIGLTELNVYRRIKPRYNMAEFNQFLTQHQIDTVLCTSAETAENVSQHLMSDWRQQLEIIVPSLRVAKAATQLGFHRVITAAGASDEAMLSALTRHGLDETP